MIEKLGGRKAIIAVLIVALGVGAVLIKGDIPANFMHLLEVIFGTFVIGNVTNTVIAVKSGASESTESVVEVPSDTQTAALLSQTVSELQAVRAQNDTITQALNTSQQGIGYLVGYVAQQAQQVNVGAVNTASIATRAASNRAALSE